MNTPKGWGNLRKRWTAALTKSKIKIFHMTDFENRQGEFVGWDEDRKRSLLTELFEAIADDPPMIFGTAVVVAHFNKLDASRRRVLMDPWYLCYQTCFNEVLSSYYIFDPVDQGVEPESAMIRACFFEQHRQYKWGPMLFALAHEKGMPKKRLMPTRGIIGWGSKESCVHFQLADMIAYELRKHVENSLFRLGRSTRWPMKQFLKMMFVANVFDDSGLPITTENEPCAAFRTGSLHDVGEDGTVRLSASAKESTEIKE